MKLFLFLKRDKIDKLLARLTKRDKTQITRIRNERGDFTPKLKEINKIIKEYCGLLYTSKLDNLAKYDKFLERHKLLKTNSRKIDNLNRPIKMI